MYCRKMFGISPVLLPHSFYYFYNRRVSISTPKIPSETHRYTNITYSSECGFIDILGRYDSDDESLKLIFTDPSSL